MPFRVLERINAYSNIKLIKAYLVNNNLIDKIGTIDFWNEKNYFLTKDYLLNKNSKIQYEGYNTYTMNELDNNK